MPSTALFRLILVLGAAVLGACGSGGPRGTEVDGDGGRGNPPSTMQLTSEAFAEGAQIPERFSCEGENLSPPLAWSKVPDGTAELALVVSDPDAPDGTFYHWVLLGLDPSRSSLAAGEVPDGAVEGEASSGKATYIGMCPPDGERHLYVFTLYALNRELDLPSGVLPGPALSAIGEAAVAQGRLTGTYGRDRG